MKVSDQPFRAWLQLARRRHGPDKIQAPPDHPKHTPRPRQPHPIWESARTEAMAWMTKMGCPMPYDGNQSKMEAHVSQWLIDRDHNAEVSTVRKYVRRWIKEFRDQPKGI